MAPSVPAIATQDISETSINDWQYVSEGGATIVFTYQGPSHPSFNGTVLRLRKHAHSLVPSDPAPEQEEPDDPMIEFQRRIIGRLIAPDFLVHLQVVRLDSTWINEFHAIHDDSRPAERRKVDTIDLTKRKAVLATDLVGGRGCAVEIKPKWGFLPFPAHLSPESASIKTRTCRTCMHTHLRQAKGEPAASDYCPLDLFSGSEERITRAIHSLWATWVESGGAVNNLRIFSNGKMLKPDDGEALDGWSAQLFGSAPGTSLDRLLPLFTATLLPLLVDTPVLGKLSTLQRTLDALDREGFVELQGGERPPLDSTPDEPALDEWSAFVDAFTSSHEAKDHARPDPSDLRYYTLAYLLSATFKDCSLIVRLPFDSAQTPIVKVIDLDMKSVAKIRRWEELDEKIVESYAKVDESVRKRCTDAWARLSDSEDASKREA
ncbi:inositol-pentakisphosphate 2-kinase [Amylostereum chailletii]|nr:inositol-pentakisphosphate 2-kinase [Amylostereum chailletii]